MSICVWNRVSILLCSVSLTFTSLISIGCAPNKRAEVSQDAAVAKKNQDSTKDPVREKLVLIAREYLATQRVNLEEKLVVSVTDRTDKWVVEFTKPRATDGQGGGFAVEISKQEMAPI